MQNSYDNKTKETENCVTQRLRPLKMIYFSLFYLFFVCLCLSLIIHIQLNLID